MRELYNTLGVSGDDVLIDLRYSIIFVLRAGILDLSEEWVHLPLTGRFKDYTHHNAVRLNRLAIDHDDCLIFDLRLINLDVAIQKIADDLYQILSELLPWPPAWKRENPWHDVQIFTLGDPESVERDLTAYLEALHRSKSDNEG